MIAAKPVLTPCVNVTITMPAGTAQILNEIFCEYSPQDVAEVISKGLTVNRISKQNIERLAQDLRDNLGPAISKIKEIERATEAILNGQRVHIV